MINKLEPGDRQLSASSWNEMRDRINNITPSQDTVMTGNKNPFLITVKNNTGYALPALSVVKIGNPVYTRLGDTFVNTGVAYGVEVNGDTPGAITDTVAITQSACPDGGIVKAIVSGATPVMLNVPAASTYSYARPIAGDYSKLEATNDITTIRILYNYPAAGTVPGYVLIGADNRQTFKVPTTYASVAKKGAVFKIYLSNNGWQIRTGSGSYILAVCQEDMDSNATEAMDMPFYTPEMNYGVAPDMGSPATADSLVSHRGVVSGEYEFSAKRLDYTYQYGKYTYNPQFVYTGQAVNLNGSVGITIEGHTYPVTFPASLGVNAGYSLTSYPDVYAGDIITVQVTDNGDTAYSASVVAVNYPVDFEKGSSIVVENSMLLGRGWDEDYITGTDFKYAIKIQGNALT